MDVLIADVLPESTLSRLSELGHRCQYEPRWQGSDLDRGAGSCDVLVVRGTQVSERAMDGAAGLRLVVRAGSGTDTIDVAAAARRDIGVVNLPGRNATAVAELTIGLLLAVDRDIPQAWDDLRHGRWNRSAYLGAQGIHGREVAIVGLGQIGLAVAERLAAFGCGVRTVARVRPDDVVARARRIGIQYVDDLDTLVSAADVVSLHLPLTRETRGLLGARLLGRLRPGTIVLNTSRGSLVDERALLEALNRGALRAGLDVFADEPVGDAAWHSRLASHPRVVATPHVGAVTRQALHAIGDGVVDVITALDAGRDLLEVGIGTARALTT